VLSCAGGRAASGIEERGADRWSGTQPLLRTSRRRSWTRKVHPRLAMASAFGLLAAGIMQLGMHGARAWSVSVACERDLIADSLAFILMLPCVYCFRPCFLGMGVHEPVDHQHESRVLIT
jgi:hypothetical protein